MNRKSLSRIRPPTVLIVSARRCCRINTTLIMEGMWLDVELIVSAYQRCCINPKPVSLITPPDAMK